MSVPISIKAQLADISAKASTVALGRALIGNATTVLASGYAQLGDVTSLAGLQAQAKSLLDQCNTYAARIYAGMPADDASQGNALTLTQRLQVAEVVRECSEATAGVIDATSIEFISWDDFVAGFKTVAETVGAAAGKALALGGKGALTLIWAFVRSAWPVLLVVLAVVVLLLYLQKRGLSAVKGAL